MSNDPLAKLKALLRRAAERMIEGLSKSSVK
jgi:hypothetical protein